MITTASLIQRIFDLAFNQGDLAILDELVAGNSINHTMHRGMSTSRLGLKQLIAAYRTGFPDLLCTIEDEINKSDQVAALWTMSGTHKGFFMGNPPTGKQMQVQGIIFARLEGGMIVAYWMLIDQFGMLQQLGIIPR
ncbi:MAG: ester cyclase [Anaerolineales bacterium]|nr:ester cyclase [Anaerolineales bacterium]